MGMSAGSRGGNVSDINMTPMIDVLLVLLIIFMIIQPMMQKTIDVQIPEENPEQATDNSIPQIVLEIADDGQMSVNTQPVASDQLQKRLEEIYTNRPTKALFVKASGEVEYQYVIEAMDAARGAGVKVLGGVIPE